jgi:hypothetical protein
MAALGFQANAQGAAAVNAQAAATAAFLAGLPPVGPALHPLMLLHALLAMLQAILRGLGVNLLAPNASAQLQATLSALPLGALARLDAQATASASAAAALSASASANAAASLNLAATAAANLSGAAQLSALLSVMAQAGLSRPGGSCGLCPLVVPTHVTASAAPLASVAFAGMGNAWQAGLPMPSKML